MTKSLLKRGYAESLKNTMMGEGRCFLERLHSPEAMEALLAFREHRKPDFTKTG
jgi:enoyl-CoA hydratase/carnithine racemase